MNFDVRREHPSVMARLAGKSVDGLLQRRPGFRPLITVSCFLGKRDFETIVGHELAHAAGFADEDDADAVAGAFMSGTSTLNLVESYQETRERAALAERRAHELAAYNAGLAARRGV
jgi:hypothetical protein